MTFPHKPAALTFDAEAIHDTIQRALASAGLNTSSGPMRQVTETIRQAMALAGLPGAQAQRGVPSPMPRRTDLPEVVDVLARRVDVAAAAAPVRQRASAPCQPPAAPAGPADQRLVFSGPDGRRAYRLHQPTSGPTGAGPVLVMLHGCTQSADDFAAGTRMNRLADEHGVLVVYPEQAAEANASRCWNWFRPQDQARGAGEPALIAGIVHEVASNHRVDPRRIFVAGLSAGAAMAVVLGQAYPELFAAVGVHSGLPYGSAHDMPSAMAKMKGGRSGLPGLRGQTLHAAPATWAVPTIVFHGDRDHLVQHSNGGEVVSQCLGRVPGANSNSPSEPPRRAWWLTWWTAVHPHRACRRRRPGFGRRLGPARRRACLVRR